MRARRPARHTHGRVRAPSRHLCRRVHRIAGENSCRRRLRRTAAPPELEARPIAATRHSPRAGWTRCDHRHPPATSQLTDPGSPRGLPVTIDLKEPLGSETVIHCRLRSGAPLTLRLAGRAPAGDQLTVQPALAHLHVFDAASGQRLEKTDPNRSSPSPAACYGGLPITNRGGDQDGTRGTRNRRHSWNWGRDQPSTAGAGKTHRPDRAIRSCSGRRTIVLLCSGRESMQRVAFKRRFPPRGFLSIRLRPFGRCR